MKKLTFLIAFALVVFYGCNKQESHPSADNQQVEVPNALVLHFEGENPVWELVTLEEPTLDQGNSGASSTRDNGGNSVHAHGDFPGAIFSGTQNNGGTHGSATLNLGPYTFTCETECLMVEDNEAVYGGTLTEVAGPPGFPFGVGDLVYFKVIDNGQGDNAPADQFVGAIRFKFSPDSRCGIWTPSHPSWSNYPVIDVPEPGSIKVNN
jgi:hypothetical protein